MKYVDAILEFLATHKNVRWFLIGVLFCGLLVAIW